MAEKKAPDAGSGASLYLNAAARRRIDPVPAMPGDAQTTQQGKKAGRIRATWRVSQSKPADYTKITARCQAKLSGQSGQ
ncbi:hypothetical protein [Vogesella fluminis]|uniref:Uncharacterized protein n=1 Tax=Vogesella fluminis TaxID=1069161 RepID=A0ABQ3HB40_9NEIS|nr:hypothetical protein [Vogesella fluminis]GHD78598.1 hypothetical protein GCM10011419_20890 [Vogesella fluminis]